MKQEFWLKQENAVFKEEARKHQLDCFKNCNQKNLTKNGRAQNHWLNHNAASSGKIFYNEKVFEAAQTRRGNKKNTPEWFYDTLRSQHIPYNFFAPFIDEKNFGASVLAAALKINVSKLLDIQFEYPSSINNPLRDRTSFDVFIAYQTPAGKKGMAGIEVKYTEGAYSLGETEKSHFETYYRLTKMSDLYNHVKETELTKNDYRQIWRNHLLAFSYAKENGFDDFISVTLYHEGNTHFNTVMNKYNQFLNEGGKKTVKAITYSEWITAMKKEKISNENEKWMQYLVKRYNIPI